MSDNYPMGYQEPIDFDTYCENMENHIKELERQLEEAREVQSKLGEWVYQYIHCMRTVEYCGSLEDALEMEQYLYELKEQGE